MAVSPDGNSDIKESTYQWSVRIVRIIKKALAVNVKLHHDEGQIERGEIFLFNHFARFETFIPQYLIFEETGAYCRSVASSEFFEGDHALSNYLRNVGAIPNDQDGLLSFLAAEILRGRKVIVFPEGGMVKDRLVLDHRDDYNVYSRTADVRRKHHTGAAALALGLDAFKTAVRGANEAGHSRRLEAWAESLRLDSVHALLDAARRPTLVVPANITFYPIRVSDNLLRKVGDLLSRGLSRRLSEELLIEGNILLKNTDMDIRLGDPVRPAERWRWWEEKLIGPVIEKMDHIDEVFALRPSAGSWNARLLARGMRRRAQRVRDDYMHGMYTGVTVNLSHLASSIILSLVDQGRVELDDETFHKMLYLAVKKAQTRPSIHLHRSLRNPNAYGGVVDGDCPGLAQFLRTTTAMELVDNGPGVYHFLPKLRHEHAFDEIRLENLVAVYANEVAPIGAAVYAVEAAVAEAPTLGNRELALLRFDDELIAHAWDTQEYSGPRHRELNAEQTATRSGAPFLLLPDHARDVGIVLVHGFLASPAEVRGFADELERQGFAVVGVRIKGHGTSPWDMRDRTWEDWLASVRRGYDIMAGITRRVCLVGFSTGGALVLRLAATNPPALAGVAAVSAPLKFRSRSMLLVPLFYNANRVVRWVSSFEGVMPFRLNESEHPDINYRHIPIRGLYELRRLVGELEDHLPDVHCPATVIQGISDPVVHPKGSEQIHAKLGSEVKTLSMVPADKHGILYDNIGGTHELILDFVHSLES